MKAEWFGKALEEWYVQNRRDLPWRGLHDPYLIWISETILQQTRISQGLVRYLRFTEEFPNVFSLASATEDEVLKAWEGLGYYSRARNLHAAAKSIVRSGHFPNTYEGVRALKGVGDYTAAAICSFAYGMPIATVDGNAYRVLSRVFGIGTPIDTTAGKHQFNELADTLLDRERPADYNQALMDFGALQCTPVSPQCNSCPLRAECTAHRSNSTDLFPVKSKKTEQKHRFLNYIFVVQGKSLLIHRRPKGGIWTGLYEPYLIENETGEREICPTSSFIEQCMQQGAILKALEQDVKHVLTHRVIHANFYLLHIPQNISPHTLTPPDDYRFVPEEELSQYAFPVLVKKSKFPPLSVRKERSKSKL